MEYVNVKYEIGDLVKVTRNFAYLKLEKDDLTVIVDLPSRVFGKGAYLVLFQKDLKECLMYENEIEKVKL